MNLRPYQSDAVNAVFEQWKEVPSTLIEAATGTGKTRIASAVAERVYPKRTLFIAHRRELVKQAARAIQENTGLRCAIEMGELKSSEHFIDKNPVVVACVDTLSKGGDGAGRVGKFDPNLFGAVICDECFPAGTMVSGRPIESIKVGDEVETHLGFGNVLHVMRKPVHHLARVTLSNGAQLVCTPEHPIWTPNGFMPAAKLTPFRSMVLSITPYEMYHLSNRDTGRAHTLRETRVQKSAQQEHHREIVQEARRRDNAIPKNERDASPGSQGDSLHQVAGDELETYDSQGQRNRANNTPAGTRRRPRMADGSCNKNWDAERDWLSNLLQGGHWQCGSQVRGGSGWELAWHMPWADSGCEERRVAAFVGVARVEILKPASCPEFAELCPDGFVYNLEVSNGNTYFADGILVHNCHHSVAPTWMKIIKYFQTNPDLRVMGITATADRSDEEALGQLFASVAYSYRIYDPAHIEPNAIDDGWLVFPRQKFVSVSGLDFSSIHTTAGDLNGTELARVMEREENIAGVVHPTLEWMFGLPEHTLDKMPVSEWGTFLRNLNRKPKSTVGFTVSVAQAEMMSDIFNRVWPGLSAWICGKTPDNDRDRILRDFDRGEIPAIWNCNCLTEGWDSPNTEIMVDASPTKSRARYAQRVGRVTRPHSSIASKLNALETPAERKALIASSAKPEAVVLDFLGNSGKHKLICLGDILGGNVSEQVLERAIQRVKERGEGRFDEAIEEEEKRLREEAKAAEAARKAKLVFKAKFNSQDVDPFDILQLRPVAERGWDAGKQLTEKQRGLLTRAGVDPDSLPYPQAKQLIGELIHRFEGHLCTLKQAAWLRKHGYSADMTMQEASRTMDAWAKNGWKRPQVQRTAPPPFRVPEPAGEPF